MPPTGPICSGEHFPFPRLSRSYHCISTTYHFTSQNSIHLIAIIQLGKTCFWRLIYFSRCDQFHFLSFRHPFSIGSRCLWTFRLLHSIICQERYPSWKLLSLFVGLDMHLESFPSHPWFPSFISTGSFVCDRRPTNRDSESSNCPVSHLISDDDLGLISLLFRGIFRCILLRQTTFGSFRLYFI